MAATAFYLGRSYSSCCAQINIVAKTASHFVFRLVCEGLIYSAELTRASAHSPRAVRSPPTSHARLASLFQDSAETCCPCAAPRQLLRSCWLAARRVSREQSTSKDTHTRTGSASQRTGLETRAQG
eukprot:6197068-Pleurochrysis_carterae.AAC.3